MNNNAKENNMENENVKPSVLLKDALHALGECERSKNYVINMQIWHVPNYTHAGKCTVCLAGSVMAERLHQNKNLVASPLEFPYQVESKLHALNSLRDGDIDDSFAYLGLSIRDYQIPKRIEVTDYSVSPKEWREDMELIVEILEDEGL